MASVGFGGWLQGLRAMVIDSADSCARLNLWLLQAGAMVTHTPALRQALELLCGRPQEFDVVLIDADAHADWERLVDLLPRECSALVVSRTADAELLRRVMARHAGYISVDAAQADFVFTVCSVIHLAAPDLARLAARGARLWALSPQLTRLLHYNLWGYSDRDIADALSISLKTAQQYQEELRRKTGVKTKQAYLRRLLTLAGQEPLLPMTDQTRVWVEHDRALLRGGRGGRDS